MGRNIKYNAELKINICRRYLNGESATLLANEYGVPHMETIIRWVRRYEILKDNAFTSSNKNKAYSAELKRKVIAEVLKGNESIPTIANKYNISTGEIVRGWVLKYNNVRKALINQAPVKVTPTPNGVKQEYKVELQAKDGSVKTARVVAVFQKDNGNSVYRIITMYPDKKER